MNSSTTNQKIFKSTSELADFLNVDIANTPYPLYIPYNLAMKIKVAGISSPLWNQFVPSAFENSSQGLQGLVDPIGDQVFAKGNQIVHRYKNRILFMPTTVCPVQCRYCFRKNELHENLEMFDHNFNHVLNYLKTHPEVNEVIFTGGDPLMLSNSKIKIYLSEFEKIESVKFIRFHTRMPVIDEKRIDDEFISILKNSKKKIIFVIHANHITEFDLSIDLALKKIAQNFLTFSQTVLLKDVNNNEEALCDLFNHFIELNIRPYYLHHPDLVKGGMHFYLSLEEGRKLYSKLRDQMPGYFIPHYMVDIPEGNGKTLAYNPETFEFSGQFINKNLGNSPYRPL